MIITVRNTNLEIIDIIDVYESLIWTTRYNRYGDFELILIPNAFLLDLLKLDRVITISTDDVGMFIEQVELLTDPTEGNRLIVSGRSLEVLFLRRIIWPVFNKNLQVTEYLKALIDWCFPESDKLRYIYFDKQVIQSDEMDKLKDVKITSQHTGDILYDVITEIADIFQIGFRIRILEYIAQLWPEPEDRWIGMRLEFYAGIDRSYTQNKNPWITFSNQFNNLGSTDDLKSLKELGTIAYIAGEEEQPQRKWTTFETQKISDPMLRREVFVDARDIQSTYRDENGDEQTISPSDYIVLLKSRGEEKMQERTSVHDYSSNVDSNVEHIYGKDYDLGDIVQIANEFGQEIRARVVEMVITDDSEGYKAYPTFEII